MTDARIVVEKMLLERVKRILAHEACFISIDWSLYDDEQEINMHQVIANTKLVEEIYPILDRTSLFNENNLFELIVAIGLAELFDDEQYVDSVCDYCDDHSEELTELCEYLQSKLISI